MIELENSQFYPMKFTPVYMHRMWGGNMMREVLHRETPEDLAPVGESWEVSDRADGAVTVANGALAGEKFDAVYHHYCKQILGPKGRNAEKFPLLVKILDAGDRLSLQVHPDERACREIGGTAEPKTEMWYILDCTPQGKIMAGLSPRATRLQVTGSLKSPDVENLLQVHHSQPHDAYFIPAGTLHAIGGGNLILEVQQNSDTTYRVSDWGRVDSKGKSRKLHWENSLKSIDFVGRANCRIAAASLQTPFNRKFKIVNQCPFFAVNELHLHAPWFDSTLPSESFHLITAVSGAVKVGRSSEDAAAITLQKGETTLIPYCFGAYTLWGVDSQKETIAVQTSL